MLLGLLVVAALLVYGVAPQVHRIYYDEDIYSNVAQNIALTGKSGLCNYGTFEYGEYFNHWMVYNKEPSGWPFLISIIFQLFGVNEIYGFVLNNLLFVGGVLICFWIAYIISGRFFPAFIGAAVYAAIPHNLVWSNTVAAEPAAAVFGGLTVLCLLVYLKSGCLRHLLLLCLVVPLASQMRAESALIGIWGFAAVLVWSPKTFLRRGVWGAGLLTLILIMPHLLHVYAVSGESWGAQGAKFSLSFFKSNIAVNAAYYFDNKLFPVVFTLLAFIGVLIPLPRWSAYRGDSGQGRQGEGAIGAAPDQGEASSLFSNSKVFKAAFCKILVGRFFTPWLILLWFILFYGIFLFFYAGSYKYGADVRFALVSFMPLAVLSGMGADRLREGMEWLDGRMQKQGQGVKLGRGVLTGIMITVIFFCWISFIPLIRLVGQEAWGARYDHQFAREFIKKIPIRSIVLTQIPTMMLLWQQGAIQTFAGINNSDLIDDLLKRYEGHVYFHYSYWCSTSTDQKNLCKSIGEKYNLEEVVSAS
ncbi:MAG: glycosyltransferase family 39 protein, partial [Deltaproteobacteria bacterium]